MMNAREKYELILKSIEQLIVENELSNREIGDKAFVDANLPMSDKEKNTIFGFMLTYEHQVLHYLDYSDNHVFTESRLTLKEMSF